MTKAKYNERTNRYEIHNETSNCISHQEIARVLHSDHSEYKMGTLVYGTYEEIEDW